MYLVLFTISCHVFVFAFLSPPGFSFFGLPSVCLGDTAEANKVWRVVLYSLGRRGVRNGKAG